MTNCEKCGQSLPEKEIKKVKIQIKNRWTGSIIFESEKSTTKEAVLEAKASGANLIGANLIGANLRGANLSGAELNCAKFYGKGGTVKLKKDQVETFLRALGFLIEN